MPKIVSKVWIFILGKIRLELLLLAQAKLESTPDAKSDVRVEVAWGKNISRHSFQHQPCSSIYQYDWVFWGYDIHHSIQVIFSLSRYLHPSGWRIKILIPYAPIHVGRPFISRDYIFTLWKVLYKSNRRSYFSKT